MNKSETHSGRDYKLNVAIGSATLS